MEKSIEIIIKKDGTVDFDQMGYEGKDCSADIEDLIKPIGKEVKNKKKMEYYKKTSVKIKQKRS